MKKQSLLKKFDVLHRKELAYLTGGGQSTAIPFCKYNDCTPTACPVRYCHCGGDGYCVQGGGIDPLQ